MKKIFALFSIIGIISACGGDNGPNGISSVTVGAENITAVSATLMGKANLGSSVSSDLMIGFQYSKSAGILPSNATSIEATDADADYNYTANVTGLEPATTYYFRSFVRQNNVDTYGETKEFTTTEQTALIETMEASDILETSATLNANLNLPEAQSANMTYGFYWGSSESSLNNQLSGDEIMASTYSAKITRLMSNTQYWYRAFIILDGQILVGDVMTFTTAPEIGEWSRNGGRGNYPIDQLAAGEWNDIANWSFWTKQQNKQEWTEASSTYHFYPRNFVYLELFDDSGSPAIGTKASLKKGGDDIWSAVSDNSGHMVLWANLFEPTFTVDDSEYTLDIDGKEYKNFEFTTTNTNEVRVNTYTVSSSKVNNAIDIAFIVDATASMADEIDFLKSHLLSIIDHVSSQCNTKIRTAAVFYRDYGDDYLTRESSFSDNLQETLQFIGKQEAHGGGDWQEAVDEALQRSYGLGWDNQAKGRMAFIILDAPPHSEDNNISKCQYYIQKFADKGIKLISITANGIDLGTEYLLRSYAMATNGTYVFITDKTNVRDERIATVGDYQIEKLSDLIARLILDNIL